MDVAAQDRLTRRRDVAGAGAMRRCRGERRQMSRRGLLAIAFVALAGCAGEFLGTASAPGEPYRDAGPSRLRIVVFEFEPLRLPLHTGLVIRAPEGTILYDPGGYWSEPESPRIADVSHGLTPELEASYLARSPLGTTTASWIVHIFDAEVPDAVARQAAEVAQGRRPLPTGACALGVTGLLVQLPGFEDLGTMVLPATLLRRLRDRDGLEYVRKTLE